MLYLWLLQSPKWNQNEAKIVCVGGLSWWACGYHKVTERAEVQNQRWLCIFQTWSQSSNTEHVWSDPFRLIWGNLISWFVVLPHLRYSWYDGGIIADRSANNVSNQASEQLLDWWLLLQPTTRGALVTHRGLGGCFSPFVLICETLCQCLSAESVYLLSCLSFVLSSLPVVPPSVPCLLSILMTFPCLTCVELCPWAPPRVCRPPPSLLWPVFPLMICWLCLNTVTGIIEPTVYRFGLVCLDILLVQTLQK